MLGDKIIIQDIHIKKAQYILPKIVKYQEKNPRFVLGIAGQSGTGKTEIGAVLQETLFKHELRAKCLHIDDYYSTHWEDRNIVRKKTGIIGKDEINWKKINKIISDFKLKKKKLYLQRIHKYLNSIEHCISPGRNIDILIIEGLYAAYSEADFKVYLDGQISDTYEFRKLRMKENPDDKFRIKVLEKESFCVCQSKIMCDITVPFIYE